jgi:hypothetical protein
MSIMTHITGAIPMGPRHPQATARAVSHAPASPTRKDTIKRIGKAALTITLFVAVVVAVVALKAAIWIPRFTQ